jgi:hypothetical protein
MERTMSKNPTQAHPAKTAEAQTPPKRQSRLPIDAIKKAITGTAMVVSEIAKKANVSERDVRLSIDAIRRKEGSNAVARTALRTFEYKGAKA